MLFFVIFVLVTVISSRKVDTIFQKKLMLLGALNTYVLWSLKA